MRFEFGKNWKNFSRNIDEETVTVAEQSLRENLNVTSLAGLTFLDIGCGSGLFSLAAKKMGATVHSFDYDKNSVECTQMLKNKFYPMDKTWVVEQGDILANQYLLKLRKSDVVYSWGVLHHTGQMYKAIENAISFVKESGLLFISIYNDQGGASRRWTIIKKLYNSCPKLFRGLILWMVLIRQWTLTFVKDLIKFGNPLKTWFEYKKNRGMSPWYDVVDWVGGYPFEVAKPEDIFNFCKERGFELLKLKTCGGGLGCNEYVFKLMKA